MKKKNPNDPRNILGKDVRAADGGNYGHRVISYDPHTRRYTVKAIRWETGELYEDSVCPRTIDEFKISYRYDCVHPRKTKFPYSNKQLKKLALSGKFNQKCLEDGECEFSVDAEYDDSGQTVNCEKCGSEPKQ